MPFASKSHAGFTLAEMLITVALVAMLMALAVPALQGVRERVAYARARSELALIAQGLEQYRHAYGDYPQTGDFAQAVATLDAPLDATHAQSKLFNALAGVFGPTALNAGDRVRGPEFIDLAKLTVEMPEGVSSGAGAHQPGSEVCAALLDPWGRRYLYYYKRASAPTAWMAPSYWLYSAGPDGRHRPPEATSGAGDVAEGDLANADNVWGNAR